MHATRCNAINQDTVQSVGHFMYLTLWFMRYDYFFAFA